MSSMLIHRNKSSFLVAEAISEYLKIHEWQIKEIKKGIAEVDTGQFIDHSHLKRFWEKKRADSLDAGS